MHRTPPEFSPGSEFWAELLEQVPADLQAGFWQATGDVERAQVLLDMVRVLRPTVAALAYRLAEEALNLALGCGAAAQVARALDDLGWISASQSEYVHALAYCERGLQVAQEHGLTFQECHLLNTQALPRVCIGDEFGARRDMAQAVLLAQQIGDPLMVRRGYVNASWIAILCEHPAEASHYLNLLEEALRDVPPEQERHHSLYLHEMRAHTAVLQARAAASAGRMEALQEAVALGQESFQRCLEVASLEQVPNIVMMAHAHQANFKRLEGDLAGAEWHARAAFDHADRFDAGIYPYAHLTLAEVYEAQARWPQALAEYQRALEQVTGRGRYREAKAILEAVARVHEAAGDLRAALQTTRQALEQSQLCLRRFQEFGEQQQARMNAEQAKASDLAHWQDRLREAEHAAHHDPLTGLLNRRGLHNALTLRQTPGEDTGLLVALLDLDHFKRVNDDFSHAVGDEVLRLTAQVLGGAIPPGSLLARYGGEEFLLVTSYSETDPWILLERCRAAVDTYDWAVTLGQSGCSLTLSIGFALGEAQQLDALTHAADEALYQAKREGRNCIRSASSSEDTVAPAQP